MGKARIIRARPGDIPNLKAIEIECGLSPWTPTAYQSELKRPDSIMLVARDGDSALGFIAGRVPLDPNGDAEINNVGVLPEFRHLGLGSRLLKRFRKVCSERRVAVIWLEVRASNSGAKAFYRRHGFGSRGIRPGFYRDPVEDAELMSLILDNEPPTQQEC